MDYEEKRAVAVHNDVQNLRQSAGYAAEVDMRRLLGERVMGIMTALGGLIGGATATGISQTLAGVGDAAIKMREAVTGDLPPEKKAELETKLADIEARIAEAQNKVNEVEAGSTSFFVAGWRPFIGWIGGLGVAYTALIQPLGAWLSSNYQWQPPPTIDTGALMTLVLGMLGIGTMRTVEKIQGVSNNH